MNLNELISEGQYQIYCDQDGVLADFEGRFAHFSGLSCDDYMEKATKELGLRMARTKFWELIDQQVGMRFWRGISWMAEGKELWNYIKDHNPIILTAPSRNECSKIGKKHWVADNLGDYEIIFKQAEEKPLLSGPNKILIDDREDTILAWKARQGIGILYTNTEDVIRELKSMGI